MLACVAAQLNIQYSMQRNEEFWCLIADMIPANIFNQIDTYIYTVQRYRAIVIYIRS